jgi:hypothetical protein
MASDGISGRPHMREIHNETSAQNESVAVRNQSFDGKTSIDSPGFGMLSEETLLDEPFRKRSRACRPFPGRLAPSGVGAAEISSFGKTTSPEFASLKQESGDLVFGYLVFVGSFFD